MKAQLGLPVDKNDRVWMSNWSRMILTRGQRLYAANDAYAGCMLYHSLEAKRLATVPVSSRLLWHEARELRVVRAHPNIPGRGTKLLLQLDDEYDGLARVIMVAHVSEGQAETVYAMDFQEVARRALSPEMASADQDSQRQKPVRHTNCAESPRDRYNCRFLKAYEEGGKDTQQAAQNSQGIIGRRSQSSTTGSSTWWLRTPSWRRSRRRGRGRCLSCWRLRVWGRRGRNSLGTAVLYVNGYEWLESANYEEGLSQTENNENLPSDISGQEEQPSSSQSSAVAAGPNVRRPPPLHTSLTTSMVQRASLL